MTSVPAFTPMEVIASLASRFSVAITRTARSITSGWATRRFIAVEMIPLPRGFVRTSLSPGLAPMLVTIASGRISPSAIIPYLGLLIVNRMSADDRYFGLFGFVGASPHDFAQDIERQSISWKAGNVQSEDRTRPHRVHVA